METVQHQAGYERKDAYLLGQWTKRGEKKGAQGTIPPSVASPFLPGWTSSLPSWFPWESLWLMTGSPSCVHSLNKNLLNYDYKPKGSPQVWKRQLNKQTLTTTLWLGPHHSSVHLGPGSPPEHFSRSESYFSLHHLIASSHRGSFILGLLGLSCRRQCPPVGRYFAQ